MKLEQVCVGGTFDFFHKGHEALLEASFVFGERVLIGITVDGFKSGHEVEPYKDRLARVLGFLKKKGLFFRATVSEINDPFTPALDAKLEGIVVSEETLPVAERINQMRAETGLHPLKIKIVPWVLAQDGKVISSTGIRQGLMDPQGRVHSVV